MDFVLIALCGFAALEAEVMILKTQHGGNRTLPAAAPEVFGYAQGTFTGNTVYKLFALAGTAVIGGACRAGADKPFFLHDRLFFVRIPHPGIFQPLFKHIHAFHRLSVPGNLVIDGS